MLSIRLLNDDDLDVFQEIYEEYQYRIKQYSRDNDPRLKNVDQRTRQMLQQSMERLQAENPEMEEEGDSLNDYLKPAISRNDAYGLFDHDEVLRGFAIITTLPMVPRTLIGDLYIQQAYAQVDDCEQILKRLIEDIKTRKSKVVYYQPGVHAAVALPALERVGFINLDKKVGFLAGLLGKKRNDLFKDPYDRFEYRY